MGVLDLKSKHGYVRQADSCYNCEHYDSSCTYGGIDTLKAHLCTIDSEEDGFPTILLSPFGICDDHNKKDKRRL